MAGIPSWTASMGIRLLSETTTSSESAEEAHAEEHEDVSFLEQGQQRKSACCLSYRLSDAEAFLKTQLPR